MFDFGLGTSELLFIAIVALIVIGPKDLPRLLRTMGQYMRKVQGMAREFQNHLNEAAKEAGVDDVKKEVKGMTNFTVTADLDKHGAEIKKAIESGAPKSPNAAKAETAKPAGEPDGKKEPAKITAAQTSPDAAAKPTAASRKAEPQKAEPQKSEPRKVESKKAEPTKAESKKAESKAKAKPQKVAPRKSGKPEAAKPQAGQKADRAPEAVKS